MNKLVKYVALPALAVSLFFGQHTSIYASEHNTESGKKVEHLEQKVNSKTALEIHNSLSRQGVPQETQYRLISKLEKGELWDSMKEDAIPVEEQTIETSTGTKTIMKFEDGSILTTGLLAVESDDTAYKPTSVDISAVPEGVTPGTITKGTGYATYKNAVVYYDDGLVYLSFLANFTILNGEMDFIDRVWQPYFKSMVAEVSNISVNIVSGHARETLDDYAQAKMDFTITYLGGTHGLQGYLKLYVGKDNFWAKAS